MNPSMTKSPSSDASSPAAESAPTPFPPEQAARSAQGSATADKPVAASEQSLGAARRVRQAIQSAARHVRMHGGFWNTLTHDYAILRKEGLRGITRRANRILASPTFEDSQEAYARWIELHDQIDDAKRATLRNAIDALARRPLISIIVPTYNTDISLLQQMIDSVRAQLYPNWELCIADDASPNVAIPNALEQYAARDTRIKVVLREHNGHIAEASNSALALATGDYVALLDHDDVLPEHALYMIAKAINDHPDARLFYSDEDKLSPQGQRISPYFKSDWNPELFLSQNLFAHLGVYETDLVRQVGGFRKG